MNERSSPAGLLALIARCLLAWAALSWSLAASAQTTTTYSNTSTGNINNARTCTSPLVRNFTVSGTNFTIADVDIGILATHSWRGDLQFTLQSPAGTRVQLTVGDTSSGGISGDNFNVRLDDSAAQLVNADGNTVNHSTSAPPYQNRFRPRNALSAFNGQSSNGTWRLEICDLFPDADDGAFVRADLYLTSPPANFADLSLTKTLVGSAPGNGGNATWRLTVTNATSSPLTANNVAVTDNLPAGFTYLSASGTGTFNGSTGVWTVGSIAPGQSRSIEITGSITATAGVTITNTAEITASSAPDSDSTVNNGANGEDDYATNSFTVAGTRSAGTPPVFSCPAGTVIFDWDTRAWTAGSTDNSYALDAIGQIRFQMANPGVWLNSTTFGGQSPLRQNVMNGGTGENSILQLVNLANISDVVTTTITLPEIMRGARFTIFDIDYGANQFADRIEIVGRYKGADVIPVLTNGVANFVIGNQAYGDGTSDSGSANGNLTVTFSSPIDTIVIRYGNHTNVPSPVSDPGQQGIGLHDFTFCRPTTNLTVLKTSSVISDPVNGTSNPKALPGATLRYCLLFTNSGDTGATDVVARDFLPTNLAYAPGTMRSGSSCSAANTAEDDDAAGTDESDPFGASVSDTLITARTATLAAGSAFALTFEATVR